MWESVKSKAQKFNVQINTCFEQSTYEGLYNNIYFISSNLAKFLNKISDSGSFSYGVDIVH